MEEARLKKLQKLALLKKEPSLAIFDELEDIQENLEPLKEALSGIEFINGEDGKDGYTPIKGKDYFDGKDGRDGKTPIVNYQDIKKSVIKLIPKPKDGKDGKNGYTPVKGKDYFDGIDGLDGEKGDKPDHKWEGTKLKFEKPNGKWGKAVDLKGETGRVVTIFGGGGSNLRIKNNGTLVADEPTKWLNFTGSGIDSITNNGNGQITVQINDDQDLSPYWKQDGNTLGAKKTLGSIDNQPIGFITNNTEKMTILGNGNVGIGTTSPSNLLNIYGDNSLANPLLRLENNGTGDAVMSFIKTGVFGYTMGLDNSDSDKFKISANAGDVGSNALMTIQSNGNIGIGTINPGSILQVTKTLLAPTDLGDWDNYQFVIKGSDATGAGAGLLLSSSIDSYGGSAIYHYDTGAGGMGDMVFYTKQSGIAEPPVEVMRLDDTGRVGIGTASPSNTLEVYQVADSSGFRLNGYDDQSGDYIKLQVDSAGYPSIATSRTLSLPLIATANRFRLNDEVSLSLGNSSDYSIGYNDASDTLQFVDSATIGTNVRMVIDNTGKIGIGTTSPDHKLEIINYVTTTASSVSGLKVTNTKTISSDDNNQNIGLYAYQNTGGSGNYTNSVSALGGVFYNGASGTLQRQDALWFIVGNSSDGSVGNVYERNGVHIQNFSAGAGGTAGTVTYSNGIKIKDMAAYNAPTYTAGLRLESSTLAVGTTKYGIYIGEQSGATNNYGIYSDGGDNYFKGNVGIGITSPTAVLHLKAGTATANTAPLKFTSGTLLTTPEAGTLEFANDRLYLTNVGTQRAIDRTSDVITSTTTVANTITETTIFTGTIGANDLKVGNIIKLFGNGIFSTANASDSITLRVKIGSTTIGTVVLTPKNYTNEHWELNTLLTVRSVGATGGVSSHVYLELGDDTGHSIVESNTIDTTTANNLTITAQWDNADASNTISIYQGLLEFKN